MRLLKYIKSNAGFLISFALLAFIALNKDAKAFLIRGLISTGILNSDFDPSTGKSDEVSVAPSLLLGAPSGSTVDLKELRGKVIFLNFWATWCPPCIAEMPSINTLRERFSKDENIVFLLVDVDGNYDRSKKFMDKHQYDLPVYVPQSDIPGQLLTGAIPTTIIIDKTGKIVLRHEGAADYSSPEAVGLLEKLSKGN